MGTRQANWILALVLIFTSLCSAQELWRAPTVSREDVNDVLSDSRTLWYKSEKYFWHQGSFRTPTGQIGPDKRTDDATDDFPWSHPGGTHRCVGVTDSKFVWFPPDRDILVYDRVPIMGANGIDYRGRLRRVQRDTAPMWTYPKGTMFGEILYYRGHPFEVRIREKITKEHGVDSWDVDIFKPYPTAADLLKVLPKDDPTAVHLRTDGRLVRKTLKARHRTEQSFDKSAWTDTLPKTNMDYRILLNKTFESSMGEYWDEDCVAPTTEQEGHIVPPRYDGAFVGNDPTSCRNCHEHVGKHVSNFDLFRDWYGLVQGSDGIFSYSLADPRYVRRDASRGPGRLLNHLPGKTRE